MATQTTPILESNSSVTVTVDDEFLGTFTVKTGGQIEAETAKFRAGGMEPMVAIGGPTTVENVTVRGAWYKELHSKFEWLLGRCGRGQATVSQQPLDTERNPWGKPLVYHGVLQRVTPPDADSGSNDVALVELEIAPHGVISF